MKPDASPTARALLALELIQGSPGISADRLAGKLGVSERAARRYVVILREAGIPIESVRGPYGGYRVGRSLRLPPLMFTAAEALGLVMAVLDGHHDASDPAGLVGSALGKIVRALPEPVAAQAEAVRRTTAPAPDRAAARPDPATTTALVQACSDHRRVRLSYRSEAGSEWVVEADPWAVVVRHGRWYLLCWSHSRAGPAGLPDRPGRRGASARGAPSARPPTSTLSPCWRSTSPSDGNTTSRSSSTRPRKPWGVACHAPSGGSSRSMPRAPAWSAAPATRRGTPNSSRRSRRRTGSCGAPNSERPRASSASGCWQLGAQVPDSAVGLQAEPGWLAAGRPGRGEPPVRSGVKRFFRTDRTASLAPRSSPEWPELSGFILIGTIWPGGRILSGFGVRHRYGAKARPGIIRPGGGT